MKTFVKSIHSIFMESFFQMCFEGKWLQNRLQTDKNELRSLSAVDIQGHQRGGFCIAPIHSIFREDISARRRVKDRGK